MISWKSITRSARRGAIALVFGGLLFTAQSASAQVAWDAPLLAPPKAEPGLGLFLADPSGGDMGFVGTWRGTGAQSALGFRVGIANDWSDRISLSGGIDLSGALTRASSEFPLDIDWVFGAGIGFGHHFHLGFPLGLSIGHTFEAEGVEFTPYLTPRVALDARFGNKVSSDLDLSMAIDVGLDLRLQPNWKIRFGGSFGDRKAVALGVVL